MLHKRLVGVVLIKRGWAVQSFGYSLYLPLGKPECVVENLCRWGADEIHVQVIDHSLGQCGPDLDLVSRLARAGAQTPLIYGGGICSVEDGVNVIRSGADRLSVDAVLHDDLGVVKGLREKLGSQAVIAVMPASLSGDKLLWLDYRTGDSAPVPAEVRDALMDKTASEILVVDWKNEGRPGAFDQNLIEAFSSFGRPLIVFGGISDERQIGTLLDHPAVTAVAIGNFLNYREHAVQKFKAAVKRGSFRAAHYAD